MLLPARLARRERLLPAEDQALLREALEKAGQSQQVMDGYLHYFRADMLSDSVRPR